MELQINAEQIIEQAASRLADEAFENVNALEMLELEISRRIDDFLKVKATAIMEDALRTQIEDLMTRKLQPVNSWGAPNGDPYTLQEELQRRAEQFWTINVDKDGKPASYGGKPRHQHMFEAIAKEQFAEAIKENIEIVLPAFAMPCGKMLG